MVAIPTPLLQPIAVPGLPNGQPHLSPRAAPEKGVGVIDVDAQACHVMCKVFLLTPTLLLEMHTTA